VLSRVKLIVAAAALTLAVGQASADTYTSFNLSGNFTDPFQDTWLLSGSLILDDTTDLFTSASIRLAGEPWSNIISQGLSGNYYDISVQSSVLNAGCSSGNSGSGCFDLLTLGLSAAPAALIAAGQGSILVGYAGLRDAGFQISLLGTGSLIDPPSPTPLPAAFPLFATGLGAVGLFGWRRKRKANAVCALASEAATTTAVA